MNIALGEMESRFADIIRQNEGISSGELVKICANRFDWKKSTTCTMLRCHCGDNAAAACSEKTPKIFSYVLWAATVFTAYFGEGRENIVKETLIKSLF